MVHQDDLEQGASVWPDRGSGDQVETVARPKLQSFHGVVPVQEDAGKEKSARMVKARPDKLVLQLTEVRRRVVVDMDAVACLCRNILFSPSVHPSI